MKPFPGLLLVAALCLGPGAPNAVAQSTLEMDWQAGREFTAADRELNSLYKRLLPALSAPARQALQAAQLRWIAYRDAWADYHADVYRGGTIASLINTRTRAELTEARCRDFEHVLASLGHPPAPRAEAAASARGAAEALEELYKGRRADLDVPGKQILAKADAAWLAFRDAELAFTAAWAGPAAKPRRLAELTRAQLQAAEEARAD